MNAHLCFLLYKYCVKFCEVSHSNYYLFTFSLLSVSVFKHMMMVYTEQK